jgi:hypothetical protein
MTRRAKAEEELRSALSGSLPPIPSDAKTAAAAKLSLDSPEFLLKDPINRAIIDTIRTVCRENEASYKQGFLGRNLGLQPKPPLAMRAKVVAAFPAVNREQVLGRLEILGEAGLIEHHHRDYGVRIAPKYPWPGESGGDRGYKLTEKLLDYLYQKSLNSK